MTVVVVMIMMGDDDDDYDNDDNDDDNVPHSEFSAPYCSCRQPPHVQEKGRTNKCDINM